MVFFVSFTSSFAVFPLELVEQDLLSSWKSVLSAAKSDTSVMRRKLFILRAASSASFAFLQFKSSTSETAPGAYSVTMSSPDVTSEARPVGSSDAATGKLRMTPAATTLSGRS